MVESQLTYMFYFRGSESYNTVQVAAKLHMKQTLNLWEVEGECDGEVINTGQGVVDEAGETSK